MGVESERGRYRHTCQSVRNVTVCHAVQLVPTASTGKGPQLNIRISGDREQIALTDYAVTYNSGNYANVDTRYLVGECAGV